MIKSDSLLPALSDLSERAATAEGVVVSWVELKNTKGGWVFRVFIETTEGSAGLADCERVSRRLSVFLDVEDLIESSYTLEVSTPGLDRPLRVERDYQRFKGKLASVKTNRAIDGQKRFLGRLGGFDDGNLLLQLVEHRERKSLRIPFKDIESGRLEVELDMNRGEERKN